IEADDSLRRGVGALPHGYGQAYPGAEGRVVVGPRINIITASEDCDPIAATPYHKNVRVRLTPLDPAGSAAAGANAAPARGAGGGRRLSSAADRGAFCKGVGLMVRLSFPSPVSGGRERGKGDTYDCERMALRFCRGTGGGCPERRGGQRSAPACR